jgi:hypothetical protein
MSRRAIWEEIYKRFDPLRPASNPAWRAPRSRSPAKQIIERLEPQFIQPRVLLTGTVGTGKSTELLRIAEARAGQDFVILLDLNRHFSEVMGDQEALNRVSSWEVVFLSALAVVRATTELLPYPIPAAQVEALATAWKSVAQATQTEDKPKEVDLGALSKAMIVTASAAVAAAGADADVVAATGVGLKVLEALSAAVRWSLPLGQSHRALSDQDSGVQTLLQAANAIIAYVQQHLRRVVLLIDGLDRIRDVERATALLLHSELIAQLACPVVVCGPFALRSNPALSAVRGFTMVKPLVNEPVLQHGAPDEPGPGVPFFCDLYARRTHDLGVPDLVDRKLLERLAYYSGGKARDFVKSIRMLAELAWHPDAPCATPELVDSVLDEARRLLETGLDAGHIGVLERIVADPRHLLPEDPRARDLLSYGQLSPYPNESEWYYPHPLLTMHLVKASPAGSTT